MNDINKHGTKWSPRPIIVTKYAKTADFGPNILILIEWGKALVLMMKMIKYILSLLKINVRKGWIKFIVW